MESQDKPEEKFEFNERDCVIPSIALLVGTMLLSAIGGVAFGSVGNEAMTLGLIAVILACGFSAMVILLGYYILGTPSEK